MATISFEITGLYEMALTKIANANSMTLNEYSESIVKSYLKNQAEGFYQSKFNDLTLVKKATLFGDIT